MLELIAPTSCAICCRYLSLSERILCDACMRRYPEAQVPPTPDGRPRHVALPFESGARDAILDLKYGRALWRAAPLARLIATRLAGAVDRADAISHVPLHWRRVRIRGFDQSALLAGALAHATGVPWMRDALRRCRHAPPQSLRSGADRSVPEGTYTSGMDLRGETILLVDDVTTTGHTLDACARALLDAGADSVRCIALASADIPQGTLDADRPG
jgi:ComF family protein